MRNLLACTAAAMLLAAPLARADYHMRSPTEIDFGEVEIEHNGAAAFDHFKDNSGARSYTVEIGTGLTPWWHTEVEVGFQRDSGAAQPTLLDALVWENMFQLAEPGEYWADPGFYIEYGQSLTRGRHASANEITFGPAVSKDIGKTTNSINLFFTRLLGPDQTTQGLDFTYAWQTKWNVSERLSPALEIYGDAGVVGRSPALSQQQMLIGPVALGAFKLHDLGLGNAGKLKYEIGYLFGATPASPNGVVRWRLELEIPF